MTGRNQFVITAKDIDELCGMLTRNSKDPLSTTENPLSQDLAISELSDLAKGVWHFYDQLKSYYEISSVSDVIQTIFVSSFFNDRILKHADDNFKRVKTYEGHNIYGIRPVDAAYIERSLDRWDRVEAGFSRLPGSILLSLVATYDSAFAEFTKGLLRSRPQRYSGSDRMYSVADILSLGSLDDLVAKVIDDEVDQQMNKSHTDQVVFFEKSFDTKIKGFYGKWSNYIEIFERRNLAAHGSLRVNDRYLKNCKAAGLNNNLPCNGDKLNVDRKYLESAIDTLIEFGFF